MKFNKLIVGALVITIWVGLFATATYFFFPDHLAELLLFMLFSNYIMVGAYWLYGRSRSDKKGNLPTERSV
jgi:hypothetical protein